MPSTITLGIDPGKTGAIVALSPSGWEGSIRFGNSTLEDVWGFLFRFSGDATVYLEKVGASPQMGVTSAFTFGRVFGELRGLLIASRIRTLEVRPIEWQRAVKITSRGKKEAKTAFKRRIREVASFRFPGMITTADLADAALIADYGRTR